MCTLNSSTHNYHVGLGTSKKQQGSHAQAGKQEYKLAYLDLGVGWGGVSQEAQLQGGHAQLPWHNLPRRHQLAADCELDLHSDQCFSTYPG